MLLTATHEAIVESVRAFAQERIRPRTHEFEQAGAYPSELFRELAELGLMGMIYRDVRVCQIYEGTSDIQRMVIARAL